MGKERNVKNLGEKKQLYPIFPKQNKNIYEFWIPGNVQEYIII